MAANHSSGALPPSHFREIPGWPEYLVSHSGEVWSRSRGKMSKPRKNQRGYYIVDLHRDGMRVTKHVSVLVLETFVGPRPDGLEACHWDGNRTNNNVDNLRWDTHAANELDKERYGGIMRGEGHPRCKLTNSQVIAIRQLRRDGLSLSAIGRRFNVTLGMIWLIVTGRNWKHLPDEPRRKTDVRS